jgi:3-hydroxyacyl-CoA dehydrogenase
MHDSPTTDLAAARDYIARGTGARVDRIAVVGGGLIGLGWAIVFARAGIDVAVHDSIPGQEGVFRNRLRHSLESMRRAGVVSSKAAPAIRKRIAWHAGLERALDGAGYVQECTPESIAGKQRVFAELDARIGPEVVLGSSTSTIPMTTIAQDVAHAERCVVVHPTNPPHVVPLVEIVPGERTAAEVVTFAAELMRRVGQSPIVCRREIPGFVLNRLQFALEREAFHLAREGIASVADVDRAVSEGLGMRWALMGPFLVEESNAASIREDLTKFAPAIDDLMAQVCRPFAPLTGSDIDLAERGVAELMGERSHDQLLAFRDELILRLRALKSAWTAVS